MDVGVNVTKKRKVAVKPIYLPFMKVDSKKAAIDVLKEERLWNLKNKPQLISLKKRLACNEFYRCNVSNKCPVKVCLYYKDEDDEVVIKKVTTLNTYT